MMTDDEITEKWIRTAKEIGFSEAGVLNPETLKVMPLVRETCAEDKCHAYNHNWTCPPACGTLDECESRMRAYKRGILVQTTGVLRRDIDTRIYRETEQLHTEYLKVLRFLFMAGNATISNCNAIFRLYIYYLVELLIRIISIATYCSMMRMKFSICIPIS